MNSHYSKFLLQGAQEARAFIETNKDSHFSEEWIERIALKMEGASKVSESNSVELEIATISRMICDSGPLDNSFSPSFYLALGALQASKKRRKK